MEHYRELLKVDEKQGVLRVARKLTEQHINPTPFEKMNVRLAVQVCLIIALPIRLSRQLSTVFF
jgi:hypothetical protein